MYVELFKLQSCGFWCKFCALDVSFNNLNFGDISLAHCVYGDCSQISLLVWSKFKQIDSLPFPITSSENLRLSDDFRGNRSWLIFSDTFNIKSQILRRSLRRFSDHSWKLNSLYLMKKSLHPFSMFI